MKKFITKLFLCAVATLLSVFIGNIIYIKIPNEIVFCVFMIALPSFFISYMVDVIGSYAKYRKIAKKRRRVQSHADYKSKIQSL